MNLLKQRITNEIIEMVDDLQADVLVDGDLFTITKGNVEKTFRGYEFTYNVLREISNEISELFEAIDIAKNSKQILQEMWAPFERALVKAEALLAIGDENEINEYRKTLNDANESLSIGRENRIAQLSNSGVKHLGINAYIEEKKKHFANENKEIENLQDQIKELESLSSILSIEQKGPEDLNVFYKEDKPKMHLVRGINNKWLIKSFLINDFYWAFDKNEWVQNGLIKDENIFGTWDIAHKIFKTVDYPESEKTI